MTTMRARIGKLTTGDLIGEPPVRRHVDEREARQVAEAARQTEWDQPSFAKELYLGRFRLDLIHPQPQFSATEQAKTDAFWPSCAPCARPRWTAPSSSANRSSRTNISNLSRALGFGMKIPREYGGPARPGGLQPGADADRLGAPVAGCLVSAHQSIGVPEPVKMFGTESRSGLLPPPLALSAFLHRARRRFRPGPDGRHGDSVDDGAAYELNGLKLWTTNGVIAELVVVMARCQNTSTVAAGSPPSSSSRTRRESPSSGATRSWA